MITELKERLINSHDCELMSNSRKEYINVINNKIKCILNDDINITLDKDEIIYIKNHTKVWTDIKQKVNSNYGLLQEVHKHIKKDKPDNMFFSFDKIYSSTIKILDYEFNIQNLQEYTCFFNSIDVGTSVRLFISSINLTH